MTEAQKNTVHFKGVTEEVYSVADGQVIALEKSERSKSLLKKMMGDGFGSRTSKWKHCISVTGTVLYQVSSQQNMHLDPCY